MGWLTALLSGAYLISKAVEEAMPPAISKDARFDKDALLQDQIDNVPIHVIKWRCRNFWYYYEPNQKCKARIWREMKMGKKEK